MTYLGTNTLLFRKGSSSLLVDPHFTRPGVLRLLGRIRPDPETIAEGLLKVGINRLDGVLLTHTHYDHALDAAEVTRQTGGRVYGSASALNLVRGAALDETYGVRVIPGHVYKIGEFRVSFHPSRHMTFPAPLDWLMRPKGKITHPIRPPTWFWNYQCGAVYAIQVDHTLIFGSAGFETGAYWGFEIDTVILGIGGLDMKPQSYLQQFYQEAVLLPGAKQVFLSHWDNFFGPIVGDAHPHILARRSWDRVTALGAQHGHIIRQLEYDKTCSI